MRSRTPKLLHEVCGRPLIGWVLDAAKRAAASRIIVVDSPDRPLAPVLGD
ncbi:MAG: NTP transferase domain-containing protein, partial [Actinomycetota bacterium]|nr:NTP transferase domain-containing protein [Actinomycetota bacterium]